MSDVAVALDDFVRREMEKPFSYGATDCCKMFDSWLTQCLGYSPLERAGRNYANEQERQDVLNKHGNMLFAMLYVAEVNDAIETDAPEIGDVAAIYHGGRVWAAILTSDGWFSRDKDGAIVAPIGARRIKAWKSHR